jgi:uncharacterized membrane protein
LPDSPHALGSRCRLSDEIVARDRDVGHSVRPYDVNQSRFTGGEVYRSTIWRTRLDNTTNWAIVTMGIALLMSKGLSVARSSYHTIASRLV